MVLRDIRSSIESISTHSGGGFTSPQGRDSRDNKAEAWASEEPRNVEQWERRPTPLQALRVPAISLVDSYDRLSPLTRGEPTVFSTKDSLFEQAVRHRSQDEEGKQLWEVQNEAHASLSEEWPEEWDADPEEGGLVTASKQWPSLGGLTGAVKGAWKHVSRVAQDEMQRTAEMVSTRLDQGYTDVCYNDFGPNGAFGLLQEVKDGDKEELRMILHGARLCGHMNKPASNPNPGLRPLKVISKGSDKMPNCTVGYSSSDHTIWVAFRGTKTADDVLTDISFQPVPIGETGVAVPLGMLQRVDAVYTQICKELWELVGSHKPSEANDDQPVSLRFVGHSLGGGLAAVLALLLHARTEGREILQGLFAGRWSILTFGSPVSLAISSQIERSNPSLNIGPLSLSATLHGAASETASELPEAFELLRDRSLHVVHQYDGVPRLLGKHGAIDLTRFSRTLKGQRDLFVHAGRYVLLFSEGAPSMSRGGRHHLVRLADDESVERYLSMAPSFQYTPYTVYDHKLSAYLPKLWEYTMDEPWQTTEMWQLSHIDPNPKHPEKIVYRGSSTNLHDQDGADPDWLWVCDEPDGSDALSLLSRTHSQSSNLGESEGEEPSSPAQRIKEHRAMMAFRKDPWETEPSVTEC